MLVSLAGYLSALSGFSVVSPSAFYLVMVEAVLTAAAELHQKVLKTVNVIAFSLTRLRKDDERGETEERYRWGDSKDFRGSVREVGHKMW